MARHTSLSLEEIVQKLETYAGFALLKSALERHFISRAESLRCYRIAKDAQKLLNNELRLSILDLSKEDAEDRSRLDRIRSIGWHAADEINVIIQELTQRYGIAKRNERITRIQAELDENLAEFVHALETDNADFEALQQIEQHPELFTAAERDELLLLLGLRGIELDQRVPPDKRNKMSMEERLWEWRDREQTGLHEMVRRVARQASKRYGRLLEEMEQAQRDHSQLGLDLLDGPNQS